MSGRLEHEDGVPSDGPEATIAGNLTMSPLYLVTGLNPLRGDRAGFS
jgi:hypothetical protein